MTKQEKLIKKIKDFFKKRNNTEVDLNEIEGGKFVLREGGLFDTKVNELHPNGVQTNGYGFKDYEDLELSDLEFIVSFTLKTVQDFEKKNKTKSKVK